MKKVIYVALFLLAAGNTVTMQAQQESVVLTTSTPITLLPPESIKDVALIRADGTNGAISYYKTGRGDHFTYLTATQAYDILIPSIFSHVSDFRIDNDVVYACGMMQGGASAFIARFRASELLNTGQQFIIPYIIFPGIDDLLKVAPISGNHVMAISRKKIVEVSDFLATQPTSCSADIPSGESAGDIVATDNYVVVVEWGPGPSVLTLRRGNKNAQQNILQTMNNNTISYDFSGEAYIEPASYSHAVSMTNDNIAVTHMADRMNSDTLEVQTRIRYFDLVTMSMYNSQAITDSTKCEATEMAYVPVDNSVVMQKTVHTNVYSSGITYLNPASATNYATPILYFPNSVWNSVDVFAQRYLLTCINDTDGFRWLKKDKTRLNAMNCCRIDTIEVMSIKNMNPHPLISPITILTNGTPDTKTATPTQNGIVTPCIHY